MISVAIETVPPGANVTLGGKLLGVSPVRVEVERAKHTVAISKDGFQAEELNIDTARQTDDAVTFVVRLQTRAEPARAEQARAEPAQAPAAGRPTRRIPVVPAHKPAAEPAPPEGGRAPSVATASTPAPAPVKVRPLLDERVRVKTVDN
jgi:PEGA domain